MIGNKFGRLTTLQQDLKMLGLTEQHLGRAFVLNEDNEIVDKNRKAIEEEFKRIQDRKAELIPVIFGMVAEDNRTKNADGKHVVAMFDKKSFINRVIVLEDTELSELETMVPKKEEVVVTPEAVATSTEVKTESTETAANLEEGVGVQKVKRMSPAARAAARASYRKSKSKIKVARKRARKKPAFKRRQKKLKALKKGRKAGSHRRFVLKTGLEQISNLKESLNGFAIEPTTTLEALKPLVQSLVGASQVMALRFEEIEDFIDDMDYDEVGPEVGDDVPGDDDCGCGDDDTDDDMDDDSDMDDNDEEEYLSIESKKFHNESLELLKDIDASTISPEEAQKIVTNVVNYLGGAVQAYIDLLKGVDTSTAPVGQSDTVPELNQAPETNKQEAIDLGTTDELDSVDGPDTEKNKEKVVGDADKLDGQKVKVVVAKQDAPVVGDADELDKVKESPKAQEPENKKEVGSHDDKGLVEGKVWMVSKKKHMAKEDSASKDGAGNDAEDKKKVENDNSEVTEAAKKQDSSDGSLQKIGELLKGKPIEGGKIVDFSIEDLMGPTLEISAEFEIEGHKYTKKWYASQDEDGQFRIEFRGNRNKVGKTPEEAAKEITAMLETPIKIMKKLGSYNGWDLYLTNKEGGMGGMAAKGDLWVGTDVSYTRPQDKKDTEEQLKLQIDSYDGHEHKASMKKSLKAISGGGEKTDTMKGHLKAVEAFESKFGSDALKNLCEQHSVDFKSVQQSLKQLKE